MGNSQQPDLMDVAIDLKMNARTMMKQADKTLQQEAAAKKKVLAYM